MRVSRWSTGTVIAIKLNTVWQHGTNASIEIQFFFEWRCTVEENAKTIWIFSLHYKCFIALKPNRNPNRIFLAGHIR